MYEPVPPLKETFQQPLVANLSAVAGVSEGVVTAMRIIGPVSGALMAYHGYKRTGSVGWAFGWSIFGALMAPLAVPVALAQGFGKRKTK